MQVVHRFGHEKARVEKASDAGWIVEW